jgi:hypothetical protein
VPTRWVVDCRNVGRGEPPLEYLSRYLYRGVIREHDLIDHDPARGTVTFRYRDAQTRTDATRTLPIADFLWTVLLHVLPSGLRRVREYGFLHGKAKTRLTLVQCKHPATPPSESLTGSPSSVFFARTRGWRRRRCGASGLRRSRPVV